jgi:pimeloyl-ACP methyl ester carboxylesterase
MKSLIKVIIYCSLFISHSALAGLAKVHVNGFDVEYELAGKGKHTILLEAGGSAGLSDWDPAFESLTKHAKVIRYSRIGNGGSAQIKKNYSS